MPSPRPHFLRGLLGVACVLGVAFEAFTYSPPAEASRDSLAASARSTAAAQMPTERDLTVFEMRMSKATRDSRIADTCGRGQLLGNTEVHVAMSFPPRNVSATAERPTVARAHVSHEGGTPKVLVLESKYPTLWTVTGSPSVIVATGEAVLADYPADTPVLAPRYAEACGKASWAKPPRNWTFPTENEGISSVVVDDVKGRFNGRANMLAKRLFDREAAGWRVQRGSDVIEF